MQILKPTVAIFLDTRRIKKDFTYPVKLRITYGRVPKYYNIGVDVTKENFDLIENASKLKALKDFDLRRSLNTIKVKFNSIETKATDLIKEMDGFSFELFEDTFFNKVTPRKKVELFEYFQKLIDKLVNEERVGTAASYKCAITSLKKFNPNLRFKDVNAEFLRSFERWMLENGNSISTVGIYLRPLRMVFNSAIADGIITRDIYPFGLRKYKIPSSKNIKKALTSAELKLLFDYNPIEDTWYDKAKDFFIFSYLCNGMNMKDVLHLKRRNIDNGYLRFTRAKTINTNRTNSKQISIFITEPLTKTIEKWQSVGYNPDDYLFPFMAKVSTPIEKQATTHQFIKMVNKHLKEIMNKLGIDKPVTTYYARHSFATRLKRSGVSTEVISESLGHSNIQTTSSYLDSFDDDSKKELALSLIPS
jgi:integrase